VGDPSNSRDISPCIANSLKTDGDDCDCAAKPNVKPTQCRIWAAVFYMFGAIERRHA
jgi:hypothetical protein